MSYIHTETFKIRTSEINHLKVIHPHALIQLMQEASMQHTLGMQVSVWDMEAINATWVLLKKDVKISHYPKLNETVTVNTFPSGLNGYFTYRDYYMYGQDGQLCATISSMWTLMNIETRKMMRIPLSFDRLVYKDKIPLTHPSEKMEQKGDFEYEQQAAVNYLHLDWNGHINNVKLIELLLQSISAEILSSKTMIRCYIQYRSEAILGDVLDFKTAQVSKSSYSHLIKESKTGREIAIAQTEWK